MAHLCLSHFNELNEVDLSEEDVQLSENEEYCEKCGGMQKVVTKLNSRGIVKLKTLL
ncbi:MAG: hypothetical protein N3B21_04160 [Clostridia bacterium]|nr:hypothetical protein [Clostridia bacterium]